MDPLRSALQSITYNLPKPISDLGVSIIGETCYKNLLLDINLESTECLKLAISKGLGIGIIAASTIVKVPQIIKLLKSRSAEGISFSPRDIQLSHITRYFLLILSPRDIQLSYITGIQLPPGFSF